MIIENVINHYKWPPSEISVMYLDDFDFMGLVKWNNEVERISKEMNKKK